jgi:hypothetical protein
MALNVKTSKRVQGILEKIREYMDIRFDHASRVNPHIRHIYEDIRWQQMASLRLVLESSKAWGPDRYYVADVLCEDNELRKKSLFLPTDQNSILNEIINLKEKQDTARRAGQLPIRDMRTFYTALEPSLERVVELFQTWIWWDLPDACDLVAFEHQYQVLQKVLNIKIEGPVMDHYQRIFRKTAAEISPRMVIEYEVSRLEHIMKRIEERRSLDAGHEMIVKRDIKDDKTVGEPYDYKQQQYSQLENVLEQVKKKISH